MKNKSILAFMNSYTEGKSGADISFLEIFKRLNCNNVSVVTSLLGKRLGEKNNLRARYYVTTREKIFHHVLWTYGKRIVAGVLFTLRIPSPDMLYVTSDALPDTLPAITAKIRNSKKIRWVQKIFHLIPRERKISFYAQRLSFFFIKRFADVIIVDNHFLIEELKKQNFPAKKMKLNHLGVDYHYFSSLPRTKRAFDGIFMSRLHKSKGIFDLVSIWKEVQKTVPHAKLAIIGTGDKKTVLQLRRAIKDNALEKSILLLGYLENDHTFLLIKSSNIFLFPSHEEGFGLTIGEVMACRVPIVAYDLPAYAKTFRKAIMTIPLTKTDLFAKAVSQLLMNKKKAEELKQKGSILIKGFTWASTVKKELELMQ